MSISNISGISSVSSINAINAISAYASQGGSNAAQSLSSLQSDISKTSSLEEALKNAQNSGNDKELMDACKSFESYFLQLMFKEMRKTINEDERSLFKKSNAEKIFEDMLYEQVAISSAENGGIGLAAFMYKQMQRENNAI